VAQLHGRRMMMMVMMMMIDDDDNFAVRARDAFTYRVLFFKQTTNISLNRIKRLIFTMNAQTASFFF
jgi:hypothetical protein